MAGAASAHQAATTSREDTSQQRAGRKRRTSADPQRAQQGATASPAAAPAALDSLSRLQQLADASPRVAQLRRLQALADSHYAPAAQLAGDPEEEELIQGQFASAELEPQLQQAPRANNTGLPDQLKSGIESLSGLSMDHVRVHYNSAQPEQLNALAYAQGSDIHVAPGQERHLPHEAWHVVQQAQGRVKPTMQMKDGVQVNDDVGLEREADVMGTKALERGHRADETHRSISMPIETAQQIEGCTTNSPDVKVANNNSAPLANGRGSAQRGGNEMERIVDQRPEAALQRQVQAWGGGDERVEQLRTLQGVEDGRGMGGKWQELTHGLRLNHRLPVNVERSRTSSQERALVQYADRRPEVIAQRRLAQRIGTSARVRQLSTLGDFDSQGTQAKSVMQRLLSDEEVKDWAEVDDNNLDGLDEVERKQVADYKKQQAEWDHALKSRVTATSCVSWEYNSVTYHINLTTATYHVTKEAIPKVHYFFDGFGNDIKDKQPTKNEGHGKETKKVFSALPAEVQLFIKNNYKELLK